MHRKLAQFSICWVHFTAFHCPLSLRVPAALNLRAGACRVHPQEGRGLGFNPIQGMGMGLGRGLGWGFRRGLRWGIHLHGGRLRGIFGLGQRGLLSLRRGFGLSWLGDRLGRRVSDRFGARLLFGHGGLVTCSCSLLLLPMGQCCSMRGIQQIQQPLNPKHLLLPWVIHPPPPRNRGYNPRVDTIGVGRKNLFTKQGFTGLIPLQRGGFLAPFLLLRLLPLHLLPMFTEECLVRRSAAARFEGLALVRWGLFGYGGFGGGGIWVCRQGGGALLGRRCGGGGVQPTTRQSIMDSTTCVHKSCS